jgi:SAM-dependent methyltransferase
MSAPEKRTTAERLFRRWRTRGARETLRLIRHRLTERYYEARYGIRTAGKVELRTLGIDDPWCKIYAPIAYRSFRAAMRSVPVRPGEDVFLDLGAGKGRVLVLAAMLPFRKVIGVEIAPALADAARRNVERAGRRLRCHDVQVIVANAAEVAVADEVTVIHLFDPFQGAILQRVVENIRASLARAPRPLTILYADPHHFDPMVDGGWLVRARDVPYPFHEEGDAIRNMYRIYRARS